MLTYLKPVGSELWKKVKSNYVGFNEDLKKKCEGGGLEGGVGGQEAGAVRDWKSAFAAKGTRSYQRRLPLVGSWLWHYWCFPALSLLIPRERLSTV